MKRRLVNRNLCDKIESLGLARKKMVFLSGPRQCGKTTLAKGLLGSNSKNYFNWDQISFKKLWYKDFEKFGNSLLEQENPRIVLDEFHKNVKWKNQIKGFYDTFGDKIEIIVTGSAKLNSFRRGADSLLGRFIHFNLHPFSIGEILHSKPLLFKEFERFINTPSLQVSTRQKKEVFDLIFKFGGFPEPFLSQSEEHHQIWMKNRNELLIRHDLKELSNILTIGQVEILASFLPERVGSPISIQSLAEDLDGAHSSVSRWLNALSLVYYHFEIKPFSNAIPRSLKKEGKFYLYDWSVIESEGARFENLVAVHLLKMIHYYNDTGCADLSLHYLRNKEKKEVDFLVLNRKKPLFTAEAKLNDLTLDKNFEIFQTKLKAPHFQIVSKQSVFRKFEMSKNKTKAYVISFDSFFDLLP